LPLQSFGIGVNSCRFYNIRCQDVARCYTLRNALELYCPFIRRPVIGFVPSNPEWLSREFITSLNSISFSLSKSALPAVSFRNTPTEMYHVNW